MGNPALVFADWAANEVNRKKQGSSNPRMKFTTGSAPVKKLTNFFIIGKTTGATECYLSGHGGSFKYQYVVECRSFKVPSGVTVNFYQPDGYILANSLKDLRSGALTAEGAPGDHVYPAGSTCTNYILTKDQGLDLTGDADEAHDWEMDYSSAQKVAADLNVVIVTVRNRWFHAGVTLKSAIADVRAEVKSIVKFNCLFCRVNEGSDNKAWDAEFAKWTT